MLFFEYPLMVHDRARGARAMSKVVGCSERHIFYLCERSRFPYEREASMLCLRRSVYHAWLFAQAQSHANWTSEEATLVEMNLAVRKAAALVSQMRARGLPAQALEQEQLICYATTMETAALAAEKAIASRGG